MRILMLINFLLPLWLVYFVGVWLDFKCHQFNKKNYCINKLVINLLFQDIGHSVPGVIFLILKTVRIKKETFVTPFKY